MIIDQTTSMIIRLRGFRWRIIRLLRRKYPGSWVYLRSENVWVHEDGRRVESRAHLSPRFDGDDDSFVTRYYWSNTDEEVVF